MSLLDRIRISTKIITIVVLMGVVALSGFGFVSYRFHAASGRYSQFITHESVSSTLTARATASLTDLALQANLMTQQSSDTPELAAAIKNYQADLANVRTELGQTAALVPMLAPEVDKVLKQLSDIDGQGKQVIDAANSGDKWESSAHADIVMTQTMALLPILNAANDRLTKIIDEGNALLAAQTRGSIRNGLIALCVAVMLIAAFGLLIASRGITMPLRRLQTRMSNLAAGDNEASIPGIARKDEIGAMAATVAVFRQNAEDRDRLEQAELETRLQAERDTGTREREKALDKAETETAVQALGTALEMLASGDLTFRLQEPFAARLDALRQHYNEAADKLAAALSSIGSTAQEIDVGVEEIRAASTDLARRTERQSASAEETAAALSEIMTAATESSARADEVGHFISDARTSAKSSDTIVGNALSAITAIEQSSQEISNIVSVIENIAFQTNLLALNAGVEAARAGEAGKGFAVVAQEVRELAQRSAKAAKEIKQLIDTAATDVHAGVDHVRNAGGALTTIIQHVESIGIRVGAIIEASREQAGGLRQVSQAVGSMDQATQQNAAMVEQSSAATHNLADQTGALRALLAQFRCADDTVDLHQSNIVRLTRMRKEMSA